jgi:hypothetical protein
MNTTRAESEGARPKIVSSAMPGDPRVYCAAKGKGETTVE